MTEIQSGLSGAMPEHNIAFRAQFKKCKPLYQAQAACTVGVGESRPR